MQPEIDVLGLPVKTFGLMFALGFLAAGAVIHRRMRETGLPADWAYEMIFAALAGGLVGSRLFWIIENPDEVQGLGDVVGTTGLVWYGGVIGGAAFVLVWARRRRAKSQCDSCWEPAPCRITTAARGSAGRKSA
jgi:phosphatidylglycerol:prolipoprotein diacylglycerol transferase